MKSAVAVFFLAAGIYLWTMPPTLPAYRDAGEMATSAYTLGVSHPPSYPLYILMGHAITSSLPLGRPAYRLTLLSALASSALLALMFFVLSSRLGIIPALGGVLLLGCNTTFWSVSIVPEMYSLSLFFAWALFALALKLKDHYRVQWWYGFAFLYGLFLGNRTELVLWAPGLLLLASQAWDWRRERNSGLIRWTASSLIFGVLGLSVYLYLPLRSMQGPWLDWNHPATLYNFIGSLTRRGYGGTLDLLSESYPVGANFLANLWIYGRHVWGDFLGPAILLVVAGFASMCQKDHRGCQATALMYFISGPFFLFLANMPPNPHALAIVEPHYLFSDLILAFWAAEGLAALKRFALLPHLHPPWRILAPRTVREEQHLAHGLPDQGEEIKKLPSPLRGEGWGEGTLVAAVVVVILAVLPWTFGQGLNRPGGNWSRVNRRWTLNDYDWCRNVLRSTPMKTAETGGSQGGLADGPVIIAKKDVQLFSLWYYQTVEGHRPDIRFIAQGLSASPWYQNSRRRTGEGVWVGPLRDADEWRRFAQTNGPLVFATTDADIPQGLTLGTASGLATSVAPSPHPLPFRGEDSGEGFGLELPWKFIETRGLSHYEDQQDFFNSDLIESYSVSRQRLGMFFTDHKQWDAALRQFYLAWSMKWSFPEIAPLIGFSFYNMGRLQEAADAYRLAIALSKETYRLTQEYHSLPSLMESVHRSEAEAHLNLGVILEKLGDHSGAESHYMEAISLAPIYAQPHYNLAVMYWNRDWGMVVREMSEYLRLNPNDAAAANYFAAARQHLGVQAR